LQENTAPVDGTVQQLSVHTVGGVVTPAQALLVIVPEDSRLDVEAMVANEDIGFVHAGQPAAIKVETYNFTHYGLLPGKVLSLSPDVANPEAPAPQAGAPAAAGRMPRGSFAYTARIGFERATMDVNGAAVEQRLGMAVWVEIDTGQWRVIDYLLSPQLKAAQEGPRER
jgi:hemolysin D